MAMVSFPPSCRLAAIAALVALAAVPARAQQKLLTIDDLYDPVKKVNFGPPGFGGGYTWINDKEFIRLGGGPRGAQAGGRGDVMKVDAETGAESPLYDASKLEAALAKLPGVTAAEAARVSHTRGSFTRDYAGLALTIGDDIYYWPLGADAVTRLTSTPGAKEQLEFSPDGRLLAFLLNGNLYVSDVAGHERALTTDGTAKVFNGKLDWVYEEEIFGRGRPRAYWWSPDSSRIAFLQIDDTPVPTFPVVDHIPAGQVLEQTPYPRSGDPNPLVKIGVVRAGGSPVQWFDTSKYSGADHLIVEVGWTADGKQVVFQVQNREQSWLDLDFGDVMGGDVKTLFRETTKAWVNNLGSPTWLKDGSFLWFSERSGFQHLYHYKRDGTLIKQVTDGTWEARTLYGVDEANGWIYFAGTERSSIGGDVYRVKIDGTGLTRLSQTAGTSSASFNPSLTMYVGTWSDASTPTQTRLHKADGAEIRVIDKGEIAALKDYKLAQPEFVQVKTKDGATLEAMLIKPPDFDPSKKYPVFEHTYAGPHAPQVHNAWGGVNGLYFQLLAQRGIVVWVCDNRSASGKGAESAWVAYKRLGETELADLEECLGYLKAKPWVDSTRIGLDGWSYGGFMTSYALTHSTSWSMGISGGTVSDWNNYDSVYTERYMLMPQNNPDGYARTAPKNAAANLHGQLLLLHGAIDDNVHMANTMQFVYELEKANKPFELLLYPKSRHGVAEPLLVKQMRERMLEFTLRTLKPEGQEKGTKE
jgi:dipeptidyl-peptidase-4